MAHEMNQQNWRHTVNIPDEFGRLWLVNLDKRPDGGGSWGITGLPIAVDWTDPLQMPQRYLDQPTGVAGRPDVNRLIVGPGLQKWLVAQKRHETDWKQRAFMVAQRMFGTAAHQMIVAEDESLMMEVGPKPFPNSAVIQAAINGHKGFLGIAPLTKADRALLGSPSMEDMGFEAPAVEEVPTEAVVTREPVTPMTWPEFHAQCRKEGVSMKDIKPLWDTYKVETAVIAA